MPSYSVSVQHGLGQPAARQRVDAFLEAVIRDYAQSISDVDGHWTENRLAFRFVTMGLSISGMLVVEESLVAVSGPLPLAAALFRGRIEKQIREELQRLLS
jgi:hypothetical protein